MAVFKGNARVVQTTAGSARSFALRTDAVDSTGTGDLTPFTLSGGETITLTYRTATSGVTPPGSPNTVILRVYYETGTGTLIRELHNGAPPVNGTTYTFHATDTGASGGAARAGTLRLYVQAIRTDIGTYNINSDANGDQGVIRANAKVSDLQANAAQLSFPQVLTQTATHTRPYAVRGHETVRIDVLTGTTQAHAGTVKAIANGTSTTQTKNIDTTWTAGQNDYGTRFLPIGTAQLVPDSEPAMLWTTFVADGANVTQNGTNVQRQAHFNVAPGISLFKDAARTIPGVNTHNGSGRTNLSRYFHRRQSASLAGPHGQVFLQTWIADGYGNPLNTVNVTLACLDSDGTSENSQSLTTSSAGLVQWDYVVLPGHKAFNAFRRTGADNPDSLGTHDIAIPAADVFMPAGRKTGDYPDPKTPSTTRSYSAASAPGRAKDVRATGVVYGSNNPSATTVDVYAVHSEVIFGGAASVNTSDRTTDANGVPTGSITRSKPTSAGSYAIKTTDVVDEATFAVKDASRHNPSDRFGRPYAYTGGFEFVGRRAVKDRTFDLNNDLGTSLPTEENLEGPLGYSIHGTVSQTFNLLAAPSDATTFGYYQGFSNLSATRDSFGLDAGATETPGFTTDNGLFGYKLQVLQYSVVRDDLVAPLELNPTSVHPGQQVRFKSKAYQILPDKTLVAKEFDSAPVLYISEENDAGNPSSIVTTITMTPIGALPTGDYEATYTPPTPVAGERQAYGVTGFAAIAGSNVQLSTRQFTTGFQNPDVSLYIDVGHDDGGPINAHLTDGDDIRIEVGAGNLVTGDGVPLDSSTVRVYVVSTDKATGTRFFNDPADQQWKGIVAQGGATPYVPTLQGEVHRIVISGMPLDRDLRFVAYAQIDGVTYKQREIREIVGNKNRHDKYSFDAVGYATKNGFPLK